MKTVKCLSCRCVLAALLMTAAFFTPQASADLLTNTWFKLTLTARGHTLGTNDITVKRHNFTPTVYANFSTNIPAGSLNNYKLNLWTKGDAGWSNSYSRAAFLIGANENFISDMSLKYLGTNGDSIIFFSTAFINTKTNASGRLRSATFDSVGVTDSAIIGDKEYYGGIALKGMMVSPSRLPFTP